MFNTKLLKPTVYKALALGIGLSTGYLALDTTIASFDDAHWNRGGASWPLQKMKKHVVTIKDETNNTQTIK